MRFFLGLCLVIFGTSDRDALSIASFYTYPGYKGPLNTTGFVLLSFDKNQTQVQINYNLNHSDPKCVAPDPNIANSCGLHVHAGFSCSANSLVGGHYFSSSMSDPWPMISYVTNLPDAAMGQTHVNFGYPLEYTQGRAFVLHDYNGERIACALLPATTDQVRLGRIGVYPGYMGSLNSIAGSLSLDFRSTSVQLSWDLTGLDSACTSKSDMENSCGIHIHEGSSCELPSMVGGHYYNKTMSSTDIWQAVYYTADTNGAATGMANVEFGYNFQQAKGRTVVIHDQNGNRISCSVLPLQANREMVAIQVRPFPGMPGSITGKVVADFRGAGVKLSYNLMGALNCRVPGLAPNSCGIHIHSGFSCEMTEVLGHYYNMETFHSDPWAFAPYLTSDQDPATGSLTMSYGWDWDHSKGRVVVLHDVDGNKVACAVLPATTDRVEVNQLTRFTSESAMTGAATIDFRATSVHIAYSLVNVEPECMMRGEAMNSCGIHIHGGTSCESRESAGKHFYNTATDPWVNITYKANGTNAAGAVNVENGYGFEATKGRVLVVHAYDGTMVACAVLPATKLRDDTGLAHLMPISESTVTGTALLDFRGMGTKITYMLTGVDARCATPGNATLSCGLHIHRNFTCDMMMVGTHYFNESLYPEDPWTYVAYTAQGSYANGSVVVSYGEDYAHSAGRAVVVHNYDGAKVSCATIPQITDQVVVTPLMKFGSMAPMEGKATLNFRATSVHIAYDLNGVDGRCVHRGDANNSCGLHIHMGKSCADIEAVGAHYFNMAVVPMDPWAPDFIVANAEGYAMGTLDVEYGYGYRDSMGRALVLHDYDGVKVACALIASDTMAAAVTVSEFSVFPGYDGVFKAVQAHVTADFKGESVTLHYSLEDVPCECSAAGPMKNSCGLHIHEGSSCSDATEVGGHYFDSTKMTDPWAVAVYTSNPCMTASTSGAAQGSLTVQFGHTYESTKDKVVVVHDYNGVKIACAPLSPTSSPVVTIVLASIGGLLVLVGLFVLLRWYKNRRDPKGGLLHQNLISNTDRTNAMRRTLSVNVL